MAATSMYKLIVLIPTYLVSYTWTEQRDCFDENKLELVKQATTHTGQANYYYMVLDVVRM